MFICLFFFVLRGGDTEPRNQYVTVTLIQGIQLNKSILQPKGGGGGDCTDKYKSKTSIHCPDSVQGVLKNMRLGIRLGEF